MSEAPHDARRAPLPAAERRIEAALQRLGMCWTAGDLQRLADHNDVGLVLDVIESFSVFGVDFSVAAVDAEVNRAGRKRLNAHRRRAV